MIKKILILLLFIIPIVYVLQLKANSYSTFDGRYRYNQNNELPNSSHYSGMQNEDILIIVDYSESMNKSFGISSRYIQAVEAINQILREMPSSTRVGLRVFGISNSGVSEFDRDNNGQIDRNEVCTASKLVMPIRANNASSISTELSSHIPNGVTPIGYSLRQAINNDFPNPNSLKHIILVTDGRENCGDDPCLYIKKVMQTRDDIKIDVIGITIDDNSYSQLSCIANNAYGRYYDATNPSELKNQFRSAFENATTAYNPSSSSPKTSSAGGFSNIIPNFSSQNNDNYNTKTSLQTKAQNPLLHSLQNNKGIRYTNYAFEFDI